MAYGPPLESQRAPDEWQGMQVDTSDPQYCFDSSGCGLALACHANACGPCQRDGDCAAGEVCVLDHCLLPQLAACRRRSDCRGQAVCILSDHSPGPRGNARMRASCVGDEYPEVRSEPAAPPPEPPVRNSPGSRPTEAERVPFARKLAGTL